MMEEIEIIISKEDLNERIDKFLSLNKYVISRTKVQKMIEENQIFVNEKQVKLNYKLKENDRIKLLIEEPKESSMIAEKMDLDIIFEDDHYIVVNKPKNMVVHPGIKNETGTLANGVMYYAKDKLSGIGGEKRPGIVHRLDKDTSGLIIIAKNDEAHIKMSDMLKNREVKKIYLALVKGHINEDRATINMPIAQDKNDIAKRCVRKDGKKAVTHFKVIDRITTKTGKYTLLEINLETGRTHQIRVHLSYIKYPIVGDEVYSNPKNEFNIKGQALHAYKLEFIHPITKKKIELVSEYPEWFKEIKEMSE